MTFMDQIKPDYGERGAGPPRRLTWVQFPEGVLWQWHSAKTTGDKLDAVFQQIADNDGQVQEAKHVGGRDWIVLYAKPVLR
jgi:hypothetical protein